MNTTEIFILIDGMRARGATSFRLTQDGMDLAVTLGGQTGALDDTRPEPAKPGNLSVEASIDDELFGRAL